MVAEMEEAVIETNARSGEAIHTTSTLAIRVPRLPFPKSVLLSHPPAGTSKFYQISSRCTRPDDFFYIGTVIPVFGTKPPEAGSRTRISLEDAVCDPFLFYLPHGKNHAEPYFRWIKQSLRLNPYRWAFLCSKAKGDS